MAHCPNFGNFVSRAHSVRLCEAGQRKMTMSRLRASLLPLFSGGSGVFSDKTKLILFSRFYSARQFNSVPSIGVETLKQSLHNCTDEEDDFSELGSPTGQELGTNLKLITEKHDKNAASTRKASPAARRSLSNLFLNTVPVVSPEKNVNVFQSGPDGRKAFEFNSLTSVTIKNIPSIIQLPHLIEVISIFGKILNASVKTVPNGLDCCDIEFESEESKSKALSVGRVTVKNFNLSVYPFRAPSLVTITICNISSETSDSAIHSMCMSLGPLEGLVRKTEDQADTLFSVDEESDADNILTRLNNTTMEGCKWSAHLQAQESTSLPMADDENAHQDTGAKLMSCLEDLKWQLSLAEVYRQDLKYMHGAIMHLQSHPCHKD